MYVRYEYLVINTINWNTNFNWNNCFNNKYMNKKQPKEIILLLCEKCNEKPEVDEENSSKNWTAYKANVKCKCGGEYKFKLNK